MRAKQYPLCLIVLLLLLSGCNLMGGTSKTVTQYVGTEGVTINFLKNAPPEEIYEDRPFPVKFELYNKGAHNVSYDRMIVTLSHDPLYITGGMGRFDAKKLDLSATELLGRSPIYPQGEKKLYSIPTDASFAAKPVLGQRESPQTDLLASVCYAYKTFLSTEVCIDTNIYQQNERSQACAAKDLKFSGGQGAPIAITDIEVTSLPVISDSGTESIRPQFIIRLQNVGGGYLIGPESLNMDRACIFNDIPKSELSTVRVTANLLKSRLVCGNTKNKTTEGLVRLENGEGEITCTVADNELNNPLYSSTQNFNTVLTVNVTYLYKASTKKTLSIQRFVGSSDRTPTGNENGKVSGYHYEGAELARDEAGRPITECSYLQAHPEEAKDPLQSRIKAVSPKTFSCSCTYDRCAKLGMGTNCFGGFCPGGSYCCTDPPKPVTTGTSAAALANLPEGTPGDLNSWREIIVSSSCSVGVYPSIVAAQFQQESSAGLHMPAGSNNPFGIKCYNSAAGCVRAGTSECDKTGTCERTGASFQSFPSVKEAIIYQPARLMGEKSGLSTTITGPFSRAVNSRNYDAAINGLQGTYATDPNYASSLRNIVESRNLRTWDDCMG